MTAQYNPTQISQNSTSVEPQLNDLLNLLKKEIFFNLNCHHLATVQSFNADTQTIQATINYTKTLFQYQTSSGLYVPVQVPYPLLVDVPVIIMSGGTAALTMPDPTGNQCLILFNDRSMDNWWQGLTGGAVSNSRAHSFSDAIAIVGLNNLNTPIKNYDTTRATLRNGAAGVGVSTTKIKIFNADTTLNTLLQDILTQLETLANTVAANGVPLNPSVATQLSNLATQLGDLIE